jgi:hypothetical protein
MPRRPLNTAAEVASKRAAASSSTGCRWHIDVPGNGSCSRRTFCAGSVRRCRRPCQLCEITYSMRALAVRPSVRATEH